MAATVATGAAKAAAAATAPAVGGVPIAFKVFPKLETFSRFRPRRYRELPIGNRVKVDNVNMQRALHHLYHDLGVLVWEGCNNTQIIQIGNILQQVIGMGGPGRMIAYIRQASFLVPARHRTISGLRVHQAIDAQRTGLITPTSLVAIATAQLRTIMRERQDLIPLENMKRFPLETQVVIAGSPPPRGIIYPTVVNPRYQVPIESFCALRTDGTFGRILGSVELYTIGGAEFVGRVEVSYTLLQSTPQTKLARPVWGNRLLQDVAMDREPNRREASSLIMSQILRPLWQLEREIWAQRAWDAEDEIIEREIREEALKRAQKKRRMVEDMDAQMAKQERKMQAFEERKARRAAAREKIIKFVNERRYQNNDRRRDPRKEAVKQRLLKSIRSTPSTSTSTGTDGWD